MAANLAKEILTQILLFLTPAELKEVSWFLVLDSMSTAWQLILGTVQLVHARLLEKIVRELQLLDQGFQTSKDLENTPLHFLWLPSGLLPADIASKSQTNFTPPDIWIHGPDIYRAPDQLIMNHRYAHYQNNQFFRDTTFNLGHRTILPSDKGLTPEITINHKFFYTSHFTSELDKAQSLGMHTSTYITLQNTLPTLWDEAPEEINCLSEEF